MIETEIKSEASLTAMTFCLWVASKCGLLVDYNITGDEYQFIRGFGLVSHSTVELIFMETKTRLAPFNAGNFFLPVVNWGRLAQILTSLLLRFD